MTATTPTRGLPYPEPNDPINGYPTVGQQLATILDTHEHGYVAQAGNADTVDGLHAANFMRADAIFVGRVNVTLDNNGQAWVNAGGKTTVLVANVNGSDFTGGPVSYAVKWDGSNRVSVTYSAAGTWQYATGAIALNIVAV